MHFICIRTYIIRVLVCMYCIYIHAGITYVHMYIYTYTYICSIYVCTLCMYVRTYTLAHVCMNSMFLTYVVSLHDRYYHVYKCIICEVYIHTYMRTYVYCQSVVM